MSAPEAANHCALVRAAIAYLSEFESQIIAETISLRAGKPLETIALQRDKTAAADRYIKALRQIAGVGPLHAEARVTFEELRRRQTTLERAGEANLSALASARSVCESILRELSVRLSPVAPRLYGPAARPLTHLPLSISRTT
jgi:hypothetical protein